MTVTPPPHLGVVHEGPGGAISDSKSSVVVVDMDPLSGGMDTLPDNNVDSDLVFINCSGQYKIQMLIHDFEIMLLYYYL